MRAEWAWQVFSVMVIFPLCFSWLVCGKMCGSFLFISQYHYDKATRCGFNFYVIRRMSFQDPPDWTEILQSYRGSELQNYFTKILEDNLKAIIKPQYVDQIPKAVKVMPDWTLHPCEVLCALCLVVLYSRTAALLSYVCTMFSSIHYCWSVGFGARYVGEEARIR